MTERLRVREIDDDEGRRLVRIIRRGSGSVVTWRRAQMVLLSAQGMGVPAIAKVAFTSEDRVRDVGGLYPPATRIAIICDNFSPHLTTAKDARVGTWAAANNAEIACTPTNSSWLNRIEAQFTALRYFASTAPTTPANAHDPPVHHLAQQPRLRRTASPDHRPGKRGLMRGA